MKKLKNALLTKHTTHGANNVPIPPWLLMLVTGCAKEKLAAIDAVERLSQISQTTWGYIFCDMTTGDWHTQTSTYEKLRATMARIDKHYWKRAGREVKSDTGIEFNAHEILSWLDKSFSSVHNSKHAENPVTGIKQVSSFTGHNIHEIRAIRVNGTTHEYKST
jgi:hypothetical protein